MQKPFSFERLLDEVDRPAADRAHRRIDIAMAGENYHRQIRFALLDLVEHFETVHRAAVEPDVQQHKARPAFVDLRERAGTVAGGPALVTFVAQHAGHKIANVAFVVDDQDV